MYNIARHEGLCSVDHNARVAPAYQADFVSLDFNSMGMRTLCAATYAPPGLLNARTAYLPSISFFVCFDSRLFMIFEVIA